ncbi:MAG: FAD-binding protein [Ardenticatenaceae bacterium]|nr:FAD-binding protein [Ardenticatenaceae bacterium]
MPLTPAVLREFERILGRARVLTAPEELTVYAYDATWAHQRPDAVLTFQETAEVAQVLAVCHRERIAVVPRGGATGLAGGAVPSAGSISLNLAPMNKILEINPRDMYAVVQPGVVNADLQRAVEPHGLFYPPDPASWLMSTIGGNVAMNAGGPRALKYGVTAAYVMALEVVLASGEVMRTGSRTLKNVTGYNLTQLIVGSEGTLGVITEITLRLLRKPPAQGTVMAVFDQLEAAAECVVELLQAGVTPLTTELMDRTTLQVAQAAFPHLALPIEAAAVLLIDVDGDEAAVEREAARVAEVASRTGARAVQRAADAAEAATLWAGRRAVGGALTRLKPNYYAEDIVVPRSAIPEMARRVRQIAEQYNLLLPLFGHIGDGNLHPTIMCDRRNADEMRRVEAAAEAIVESAIELGGVLTGEHGVGLLKRDYLPLDLNPVEIASMRRIKQALDPHNILNPGKLFPPE